MLLSSGDSFPHLIKKRRPQLGFVTYLLNYPRTIHAEKSQTNVVVFSVANISAYDAIIIFKTSTLSTIHRLYERYVVQ